jgi:hypothetical protein
MLKRTGAAVDRQVRFLAEIVDAQIIQSHDMIRVSMGVEDRVQAIDAAGLRATPLLD